MISTPPAYSQTPGLPLAPNTVNTAHAHQNHGYNQQQDPNMSQSYSLGQQPYYVNHGCPQIIYASQPVSPIYDNFKSRQSVVLGICKIIIGILCIAFNVKLIRISDRSTVSFVGYGIWGGILIILAGASGVAGGKIKSKCWIITYMVMCIIAAMAAVALLSLQMVDIATTYSDTYDGYDSSDGLGDSRLAMAVLLIGLPAIAVSLCIWGSALCCMISCCSCCRSCCCSCCVASQSTPVAKNQPVQFVQWTDLPQSQFVAQANSTPQGMPYPGYPIGLQVATNAPAYEPVVKSHANPINGGIPSEPADKRPIDETNA